jgi:hypothetical protein
MRRAGALLIALWLSVSLVERAVPVRCVLHDGVAAPTTAHHGEQGHTAGGHGSHDGSHQCRCLEQCAASAAFALPGNALRAPAAFIAERDEPLAGRTIVAPARTGTRLPFANGPPHALSA